MIDFKDLLIEIRNERLLPWRRMAKEIGITRMSLWRIVEKGLPLRPLTFERIIKFIEKNRAYLKSKKYR